MDDYFYDVPCPIPAIGYYPKEEISMGVSFCI